MLAAKEAGEEYEVEEGESMPSKECLFDEKYFLFQFDEDNPAIIIPDEVHDDQDHDWIIEADQKDAIIEEFLAGQQEAEAALAGDSKPPGKK